MPNPTAQQLLAAKKNTGSMAEACKLLGVGRGVGYRILNRAGAKPSEDKALPQETFDTDDTGDRLRVLSISDKLKTVDDVIAYGGFDLALWQVAKCTVKSDGVWMKPRHYVEGKRQSDGIVYGKVWRISVELKRKVARTLAESHGDIIERMKRHAPRYPRFANTKVRGEPHLVELALHDAHFGKYAWGAETGGADQDLQAIEGVYYNAGIELVDRVGRHSIERFLLPIGSDFFHYDNPRGQTSSGTQLDYDSRYAKVFFAGYKSCVRLIDYLAEIAPVDLLWVPGNHDRQSSYNLAVTLHAHYHRTKRVSVDVDPRWRKYYRYGRTVIGMTHGDMEPKRDLPAIMLSEARELMADADTLEIHTGHLHKAGEVVHRVGDTLAGGVRVRELPSLSASDHWHYTHGYRAQRAAEAYIWGKTHGYVGHFSANVFDQRRGAA